MQGQKAPSSTSADIMNTWVHREGHILKVPSPNNILLLAKMSRRSFVEHRTTLLSFEIIASPLMMFS